MVMRDISLSISDKGHGCFIYNNELFSQSTIERIAVDFVDLLHRISWAPESPIGEV